MGTIAATVHLHQKSTSREATRHKIGYVKVGFIVQQIVQAADKKELLSELDAQLTNEMNSELAFYEADVANFEHHAPTLNVYELKVEQDKLADHIRKLQDLQLDHRMRLLQAEANLEQKIERQVQDVASRLKAELGYSYILDADNVLSGPEGDDLTRQVLQKINTLS